MRLLQGSTTGTNGKRLKVLQTTSKDKQKRVAKLSETKGTGEVTACYIERK